MHAKRRQRLTAIFFVIMTCSIAVSIILYNLSTNINFFYTPSQVISGDAPRNTNIRVGGMVQSVKHSNDVTVYFSITDFNQTLEVKYQGVLPDLFRVGQGVVVQGKLDQETMFAEEVLAKHDENYMPPELRDLPIRIAE